MNNFDTFHELKKSPGGPLNNYIYKLVFQLDDELNLYIGNDVFYFKFGYLGFQVVINGVK